MGIAVKTISEQTKPESAESKNAEDEWPCTPFVFTYDAQGYLTSDGQPMAEYDINRQQMTNTIESLKAFYGDKPVYVSGNNYIHYREDDYTGHVSPDAYVVFGAPNDLKDNYKVWEHGGHLPAIVFEFTSKKTKKEDEDDKFDLYEQVLRVPEYILFDPNGDYLTPPFQGWRLDRAGNYQRIPMQEGRMHSESLKMFMEIRDGDIRFFNAKNGEYLRTPYEAERERLLEKARADRESIRAERATQARRQEAQARQKETQRADGETKRAEEAEAEIRRLQARLEALTRSQNEPE